jgi:glyoxylase-like metal-dependent hydrolase (beta-lactamase superfamily II)
MRMRMLEVEGWRVFALTDCRPAPAECAYSFPDAVLDDHPDAAARWFPGGAFRTRFGPFLLRRAGLDVLVDCGLGPGGVGYFPNMAGNLPERLMEAGSSPEQVAAVVFTHLHVDHVGWAPFLPRARFHVAARELAHWQKPDAGLPHHMEAIARCVAPLAANGKLATVEVGTHAEVLPGLELIAAHGHSPGHCAVLVGGRLLVAGDAWHNPSQVAVPSWCHRADMDKPTAIAARTRLAAQARAAGWTVAAGHFIEENAFGRIVDAGEGLAFAPLEE